MTHPEASGLGFWNGVLECESKLTKGLKKKRDGIAVALAPQIVQYLFKVRLEMANVDLLVDMPTLDTYCTICKNISNFKWTQFWCL